MLYGKRLFDIVISLFLLIAFSWLLLLVLLLYIITFNAPFFFVQQRVGKDEQIFELIKFRTLKDNTDSVHNRRFWLGDILRFFSIDELPQLLNVLKGEMSLIGPRPLPVEYLPLYSKEQRQRHFVRPGITGWAQVNGRHSIAWGEKFKFDLYYVNNLSFIIDVKILFKTIGLIIAMDKDTSLLEEKFKGNQDD